MHSVRVTHRRKTGKVKVDCVPPEEIIVDRRARSIENADLVAHRAYLTISDLVSMGYDYDEMEGFATNETDFELFNEEARERLKTSKTTVSRTQRSSAFCTSKRTCSWIWTATAYLS